MKYRSRTDIIASLLETADRENRVGITKLMYTSFLSYYQITSYMKILMKDGFLENDKLDRLYKITAKGRQFLGLYSEMNEMLKPIS
jgi:predicted transcriptional regulator